MTNLNLNCAISLLCRYILTDLAELRKEFALLPAEVRHAIRWRAMEIGLARDVDDLREAIEDFKRRV